MEVTELRPGLWRWTVPHPDWGPEVEADPDQGWARDVGCAFVAADDAICLVDPLVPADDSQRFWASLDADVARAGTPVAVLLTIFFHERSAGEVATRYGAEIWAPADSVSRLGVEVRRPFRAGDDLPGGLRALDAGRGAGMVEAVYWSAAHRAVIAGDALVDLGRGLELTPWFRTADDRERSRRALLLLLDLPVELVLPSHGPPVAEGAAERLAAALS